MYKIYYEKETKDENGILISETYEDIYKSIEEMNEFISRAAIEIIDTSLQKRIVKFSVYKGTSITMWDKIGEAGKSTYEEKLYEEKEPPIPNPKDITRPYDSLTDNPIKRGFVGDE